MIQDLKERADFWAEAVGATPDVYSVVFFDERKLKLFDGRNVLEVGPGDGAQYRRLKGICRSYAIADISAEVLLRPIFEGINTRLHIQHYDQDFKVRFDVIHFWRVIHHVLPDEVREFGGWLHRHLRPDGLLCFDLPDTGMQKSEYGCDGKYTVPHTLESITVALKPFFAPLDCEPRFYCGRPK